MSTRGAQCQSGLTDRQSQSDYDFERKMYSFIGLLNVLINLGNCDTNKND